MKVRKKMMKKVPQRAPKRPRSSPHSGPQAPSAKTHRLLFGTGVRALVTRFKRIMLILAGLLLLTGMYIAYSNVRPVFESRPGQAALWTGNLVAAPLVRALPWWFWGGLTGITLYLWVKHKLVMSILLGLVAGLLLALAG